MSLSRFILLCWVMVPGSAYSGYHKTEPGLDTIRLVAGSQLITGGEKHRISNDTTIIIPEDSPYRVKRPHGGAGEVFFDSLELRSQRNRWTGRLYDIIITPPRQESGDEISTQPSNNPFIPYGGRVIRHIHLVKIEPFGRSIHDTTYGTLSRAESFGNDLHRITQDRVIRNHLLFEEGELADPNEIADNERIMRQLSFIQDARILLNYTGPSQDSVDVTILIKDVFSLGAGGALDDYNAGVLNLFEKNVFGMGHELHLNFQWDLDRSPRLGNEILYRLTNIAGSFINAQLGYSQIFERESYRAEFNRKFFTPNTRWAGGLTLERTRTREWVTLPDSVNPLPVDLKFNIYDGWLGRAFFLPTQTKLSGNRLNFVMATRLSRDHYIERPEVDENLFYDFQNKYTWLNSFSLSSQSFFQSNLIFSFGRTEDIPQGMLLSLSGGLEFNEFNRRLYTSASFSQGRYIGNFGYLYSQVEAGGFLLDNGDIEQGVLRLNGRYFSPLIIINQFKLRHFASAGYVRGIGRFSDEFLILNDDAGIRGFRTGLPRGTHKTYLNYELNAFTPFYLVGFRFVFFGFTDMALIGDDQQAWHDGRFYSGYGLGVRIRNERMVFETISIRLGYYPNHPEKSLPLILDIQGEPRLNPKHFRVTRPEILRFD